MTDKSPRAIYIERLESLNEYMKPFVEEARLLAIERDALDKLANELIANVDQESIHTSIYWLMSDRANQYKRQGLAITEGIYLRARFLHGILSGFKDEARAAGVDVDAEDLGEWPEILTIPGEMQI